VAFGDNRKPLKRGKGLARTQWKRKPVLPDKDRTVAARKPRKRAPDPITPAVTAALYERSGGHCEVRVEGVCTGWGTHRHHRLLRRHGDHTLANLLHVCTPCHDWVHGHPKASYAKGWLRRAP
jgi:hypothetical protein